MNHKFNSVKLGLLNYGRSFTMSFELIPLLATVGTSLGVSWLAKGNSGPLETLDSLWYLAFGNLNESTADKRYEAQINRENSYLKDSVEKIAAELGKVPEDCIQEPRENIVKPALEALKIYNSEEELRTMFAKLISSAMDSRMNSFAHPSFVEMIKQLSPADAQNLKIIYKFNSPVPIARLGFTTEDNKTINEYSEIFLDNPVIQDQDIQSSSITNLDRLGLAKIDYTQWISDKNRYKKFELIPEFSFLKKQLRAAKVNNMDLINTLKSIDDTIENIDNTIKSIQDNKSKKIPEGHFVLSDSITALEAAKSELVNKKLLVQASKNDLKEVKVKPGLIKITSLGNSFCTICLS